MTCDMKRRKPLVLVVGGDSPVRQAIIEWLDVAIVDFVLPVRVRADADTLLGRLEFPDLLHVVEFDSGSGDDFEVLGVLVEEIGDLHNVVDAIGGWQVHADGRVDAGADGSITEDLHHRLAAAMFPILSRNGGTYVQVVWAEQPHTPAQDANLAKVVDAIVEHGLGLSDCESAWNIDPC